MRDRILFALISGLFALLIAGLVYTQVFLFDYYSKLSKDNVIRIIPIDGPRGTIFDRKGVPVVTNRLSFDVAVVYQELSNREKLIRLLSDALGRGPDDIERSLGKAALKPYVPVTIVKDIEAEKAFMLEEESFDIRGLIIETKSRRNYPYGPVGAHVFGYLSEITEEELDNLREYGYRMKDLVGRDGLEKYYDRYLTGIDGGIQIQVDNKGRQVRTLGLKEPSSGKDLYLTIDIALQTVCDEALGGRKGAIIVMDPKTGEVLALASHPGFDPNIFIRPDTSSERLNLIKDKRNRPLFNRAISGAYPPGSVFKVVVASAALELKRLTRYSHLSCSGSYMVGNTKFDCWKETGHGSQDITESLMNSCNVFFYQTGRSLGVDAIEAFAKLFGFGKMTGIDLPDEAPGVVPGKAWKRLHRKDIWYEGDTVNYAIGQGYLLSTPVQIAEMMAVIANKGSLVRPFIVKRIDTTEIANPTHRSIGLSDSTIRSVREGLYKVVNSEEGTGKHVRLEGVVMAGKTGTAQNPQGRTHAWFTGFAPFSDPKICLVVFLEHGGKGGLEPSEIAKEIFKTAKKKGYL